MSNYLAIATVTAALQRTLQTAVQTDVEGARVTTVRPDMIGSGTPETGVNLYLYRAAPNAAWRNAELTTRTLEGQVIKRPQQVALDLDYLFTCYGNEVELEPQRLLGSVVRTMHSRPILTRQMVLDTLTDATFGFLALSDLAEQMETVKLKPLALSTEELSNLWSMFSQKPHTLSIAYQGTVVLIDAEDAPRRALPVRDRKFYISPNQPVIHQVIAQAGLLQPIDRESTILVRGQRLQSQTVFVRVGLVEVSPQVVQPTEITLDLAAMSADQLRAGIQSLQVIQRPLLGEPAIPDRGVESNTLAFVLRPIVTGVSLGQVRGSGDDPRAVQLTMDVEPVIDPTQRVMLVLNSRASNDSTSYIFKADPRQTAIGRLTFVIPAIKAGDYLVRLRVDDAESLLTIDTTPGSPTFEQYIAPNVVIP